MTNSILHFDGQDDFIELPPSVIDLLVGVDFTVEARLFFPAATSEVGVPPIAMNDTEAVDTGLVAGNHPVLGVETAVPTSDIRLAIDDGRVTMRFNGNDGALQSAEPLIESGRWYHIAWRYTEFTGEQAIFIDGQLSAHRRQQPALNPSDSRLVIGRWSNQFMQGAISELRIWSRAHNRLEIQANINRLHDGQEEALAALWRLDAGQGTTAADSTENNQQGSIQGATWVTTAAELPFRQPLPPKKMGGEAHSFLSKIRKHTAAQLGEAQLQAKQKKTAAQAKADQKVQKAHQDATKKANATKFRFIYFVAGGAIHRLNPAGTVEKIALPLKKGAPGPPTHPRLVSDLTLLIGAEERLYWVETNPPFRINCSDLDGSNVEIIFPPADDEDAPGGENPYHAIRIDTKNEWLYWIDGAGFIRQVSIDGRNMALRPQTNITTITKDGQWRLDIDQGRSMLYWTDGSQIWRLNLGNLVPEIVVSNAVTPFPTDIAVDSKNEKIFWLDKALHMVRCANLDGSQPQDLYPAKHPSSGLTVDPDLQEIYWVAGHENWEGDEPGLVSYWRFDEGEGEGAQANDFTHNGNHGVIQGATWVVPTIKPPLLRETHHVLQFDGVDDHIDIGKGTHLNIENQMTIEAWVRPDNGQGLQATILSKGFRNYEFQIQNGRLVFEAGHEHQGNIPIQMGEWVHLAVTFNATLSRDNVKLYVNGQLDRQFNRGTPLAVDQETPLNIGRRPGGNGFGFFKGEIAEIRLWNRARSEDEILTSMKRFRSHYLMRGDIDGIGQPEKLFAMPAAVSSLTILTKTAEAHAQRLAAYRSRQLASQNEAQQIANAHADAHGRVQDKHAALQDEHDNAVAKITAAQADAESQRREANRKLADSKTAAQLKKAQAQQAVRERRQQALQQASDIKDDAHSRSRESKKRARDKLQEAKKGKAKY